MAKRSGGKAYYMISAVAQKYNIHPQTLRLYEREGLLKPSRTEGNTRLYSEEDLEQLETILSLTRDLGVNLAGVEIILNMRRKIEAMQHEVNEFMDYVKRELSRGIGDWEQRLSTALVKSSPTDLVRSAGHAAPTHHGTNPARTRRPPPRPPTRSTRTRRRGRRRPLREAAMRREAGEDAQADALQAYLRAIARLPRLTPEQEQELGRRIQRDHDQEALRRLVEGNLRFVVSYAKRYRGLGVSFLDLIHEGNLGLMEAARRFDPERNVKFITYAVWWIRQALTHALSTQTRAFSLPQKVSGAAARLTREVAELTEQLERAPTSSEIAADTEMSEADVAVLMRLGARDVSLSDRMGVADDESGPEIGDLIESPSPPIEEDLVRQSMVDRVRAALSELDDKERAIVELRFGLDRDGEMRTLQEIGEALHLSRERIRQIEARAKEKLRRSKRANELRSYLN